MPLPRALARFNRLFTNKVLGLLAYITPPFALVVHKGRKSGSEYRTPVWAFRTRDGFVIPLTYGASRTDWVKNVLAHGGAKLVMRRRRLEVGGPRLIHGADGRRALPLLIRPGLRLLGVEDYLVLH
ncbi:MAG TPA: nitroreductase family deazaflavin-dependent oxidoreductase [Actinomycetota bacterium]|nr:nitroreductase family deazaflavin-dependent oxidoreductase [Actinomycetota bacterium]